MWLKSLFSWWTSARSLESDDVEGIFLSLFMVIKMMVTMMMIKMIVMITIMVMRILTTVCSNRQLNRYKPVMCLTQLKNRTPKIIELLLKTCWILLEFLGTSSSLTPASSDLEGLFEQYFSVIYYFS